jgi:hypothetical protein
MGELDDAIAAHRLRAAAMDTKKARFAWLSQLFGPSAGVSGFGLHETTPPDTHRQLFDEVVIAVRSRPDLWRGRFWILQPPGAPLLVSEYRGDTVSKENGRRYVRAWRTYKRAHPSVRCVTIYESLGDDTVSVWLTPDGRTWHGPNVSGWHPHELFVSACGKLLA